MREGKYYIAIFQSKNHAIQLLYVLENLGYERFKLISTPCQIKGGCNYCIKFNNLNDLKIIKEEGKKLGMNIQGLYSIERKNGKKTMKKLNHII